MRQRVVTAHGSGRAQLYTLITSHALAAALAALFQEEQLRWEVVFCAIRDTLVRHGAQISAA